MGANNQFLASQPQQWQIQNWITPSGALGLGDLHEKAALTGELMDKNGVNAADAI
jgi:hypothetical protein